MANKRAGDGSAAASALRPLASAIQIVTGPWTRENGVSWIKLILFVLSVWWLLIQPFRIPSQSMFPTLNGDPGFFIGDRVFVNKLSFGPRIPFTTTRLWNWGHPRRFDVVVFKAIDDDSPKDTVLQRTINFFLPKVLIKRVVGLPGERIHIDGQTGTVYVNGKPLELPETLKNIPVRYTNDARLDMQLPVEEVERQMRAQGAPDESVNQMREEYAAYRANPRVMKYACLPDEEFSVVPPGHYLCLGDNSASSYDSRYWGWVPENWMFGRAFCVWWPVKHRKDLSGFTDTFFGMVLLLGVPGILLSYEFIIRPFCAVSLRVRGDGMSGALRRGDRVIINRLTFGIRRPFSDKRITNGRPLRRGELVAYFVPGAEGLDNSGEALLGRVAGLPGDALSVENSVLFIAGLSTNLRNDGQEKGGGIKVKKNTVVPQGMYLLLSDDDDSAPDSRTFGFVSRDLVIGPATAVWWPPHRLGLPAPKA